MMILQGRRGIQWRLERGLEIRFQRWIQDTLLKEERAFYPTNPVFSPAPLSMSAQTYGHQEIGIINKIENSNSDSSALTSFLVQWKKYLSLSLK
jgi:hypothetical protein